MILIVDDNPSIREILEVVLTSSNYAVRCAQNGSEALSLIEKNPPRLVILDLSMPGMTGYEVLERIRGLESDSCRIPVICLSALPPEEERERALSKGARDYISKPFKIPELLERVHIHAEQGV